MAQVKQRDWRELCDAVTNETDSKKLDSLVQELITALDEGEQKWRRRINSFGDDWLAA
jgi:3-methyladenine DNA glycosylase AlkD